MNRRLFVASAPAGAIQFLAACQMKNQTHTAPPDEVKLAGMGLGDLRSRYRHDLFDVMLPFWDQHGIDHELGGVMHALDYDGTRIRTEKQLWFQGRAIWVYSFLYNHFGNDERYIAIARKTKDFVLSHAVLKDGWWAEELSREGKVVRPFQGDIYGMYFVAEGLQEYAWATKDEESLKLALDLVKKLHRHIGSPGFQMAGTGPGIRPQGLWMVNLRIATQMLPRWKEPELEELAAKAVDAVVNRHFNPDIGLNNENLNLDFSRPKGEETKSILGHSIETLWMVMDEALRRNDEKLWSLCADRIRRHVEIGWDYVYGGLSQWINVDQGGYQWPVERPVGTDLEFKFVGEFQYMKTLWSLNEILVAGLNVFERTRAEWAARFFGMAQQVIDERFSRKKFGQPGFMLFGDRRMTSHPHTARQDNYHPPRQLMLNLITLDRMLGPARSTP